MCFFSKYDSIYTSRVRPGFISGPRTRDLLPSLYKPSKHRHLRCLVTYRKLKSMAQELIFGPFRQLLHSNHMGVSLNGTPKTPQNDHFLNRKTPWFCWGKPTILGFTRHAPLDARLPSVERWTFIYVGIPEPLKV